VGIDLHLIGKKGISYFRFAKRPAASQRTDIGDKPKAEHAAEIVGPLMAQFESGALDAVEVVFAQFKSAVSTPPTTLRVLDHSAPIRRQRRKLHLEAVREAILEQLCRSTSAISCIARSWKPRRHSSARSGRR